jgi:hypothetical protein
MAIISVEEPHNFDAAPEIGKMMMLRLRLISLAE